MIAQVTRTGMSPGRGQSLGLWNFSFFWRRRHTSRELADSGDRGIGMASLGGRGACLGHQIDCREGVGPQMGAAVPSQLLRG